MNDRFTTTSPLGAARDRTQGADGALLLSRSDVERLLTPDECIAAVEDAFRQHALEHGEGTRFSFNA